MFNPKNFSAALQHQNEANRAQGQNGADGLVSTQERVLDLFAKVVPDMDIGSIRDLIYKALEGSSEDVADTFVVALFKRAIKIGEGRRRECLLIVMALYELYPRTMVALLPYVVEFGYVKDLFTLWAMSIECVEGSIEDGDSSFKAAHQFYSPLVRGIVELVGGNLHHDNAPWWKWVPSEGSALNDVSGKRRRGRNIKRRAKAMVQCAKDGVTFVDHSRATKPAKNKRGYTANQPTKPLYWWFVSATGSLVKISVVDCLIRQLIALETDTPFGVDGVLSGKHYARYRLRKKRANQKLGTIEPKMSAGEWSSIDHAKVTSRSGFKYASALLNETVKGSVDPHQEHTGNRHPEDEGRVQCRRNLIDLTTSPEQMAKLNVSGLYPHEILHECVHTTSSAKRIVARAKWVSKVSHIKAELVKIMAALGLDTKYFMPMADISGSMTFEGAQHGKYTAKDIALALTVHLSEVQDNEMRNLFMTFSGKPHICQFEDGTHPDEKIAQIERLTGSDCYNTNFKLAIERLLTHCQKAGMVDLSNLTLVVFTDGHFDTMDRSDSSWATSHTHLMRMALKMGLTGFPTICYWNLSNGDAVMQAEATHPGVIMLQGWSDALFRYLIFGEEVEEQEVVLETGDTARLKTSTVTPLETMRKALDQEAFYGVREILSASTEGKLAGYHFVRPVDDTPIEASDTNAVNSDAEWTVVD